VLINEGNVELGKSCIEVQLNLKLKLELL